MFNDNPWDRYTSLVNKRKKALGVFQKAMKSLEKVQKKIEKAIDGVDLDLVTLRERIGEEEAARKFLVKEELSVSKSMKRIGEFV